MARKPIDYVAKVRANAPQADGPDPASQFLHPTPIRQRRKATHIPTAILGAGLIILGLAFSIPLVWGIGAGLLIIVLLLSGGIWGYWESGLDLFDGSGDCDGGGD